MSDGVAGGATATPPAPTVGPRRDIGIVVIAAVALLLVVAAFVAALRLGDERPVDYPPGAPEATLQRYLDAMQDQDYDTAYALLSNRYRDATDESRFIAQRRYLGDIDRQVSVTGSRVTDNRAVLDVSVRTVSDSGPFSSGFVRDEQVTLVKEENDWRLERPPDF